MNWNPRTQSWGTWLLAIWLIITGATPLLHHSAFDFGPIPALLALAAGVLLLLGR